ncbi:hypothetical protein Tco_0659893 [Tanacetum coccineum]
MWTDLVLSYEDSDSDVKEDTRSSKKFLADLNAEFHNKALLANQRRYYKISGRDYKRKCKGLKAEIAIHTKKIDSLSKGKSKKGLIAELFDWDEELVSSEDERVTKVKAFMAIFEENIGWKEDARLADVKKPWLSEKLSHLRFLLRKAPKILSLSLNCKYYGFNDHHYDECEYYPGCDICGSIAHETTDCTKKPILTKRKPRIANSGCSRHMTGVKQYLHRYSKESGPKVSLFPPIGDVNVDDSIDKSSSKTSVQPVTQPKEKPDKKLRRKKILVSSEPKASKIVKESSLSPQVTDTQHAEEIVATANATHSLEASELVEEQGNQPKTADTTKGNDLLISKRQYSEDVSGKSA